MGGCQSNTVLSQVQTDATCSKDPVKPHKKKSAGGSGCDLVGTNAKPQPIDVETAGPPGSVHVPYSATGSTSNATAQQQQLPTAANGTAAAETVQNGTSKPTEVSRSQHMPDSAAVGRGPAAATARSGMDAVQSRSATAGMEFASRAGPSGSPGISTTVFANLEDWHLIPIQATESQAEGIFKVYSARVPKRLSRTMDTSWETLAAEMGRMHGNSDALQWYWVAERPCGAPQTSTEEPSARASASNAPVPSSADGLAVFRVIRGATTYGQVFHLSLTGEKWCEQLLSLLHTVRREMFRLLPIVSIRYTLWYSDQDDEFRIDQMIEAAFKQASWRWFQLANASDGTRGQIMQLRRYEDSDPPAPQAINDICISSCLFLPYKAADNDEAAPPAEAAVLGLDAVTPAEDARTAANGLVMAECLRRHALAQREKRRSEDINQEPGSPHEAPTSASAGAGKTSEATSVDRSDTKAAASVSNLMRSLRRRGSIPLVQSVDARKLEDCEQFAKQCLATCPGSQGTDTAWMTSLGPQLQAGSGVDRVLCGGVGVSANWREHQVEPAEPSWVRVPAYTLGKVAALGDSPVAYLATEDANIFVIVWRLPVDTPDMDYDELYQYCQRVMQEVPPDAVAESADLDVVLPRFQIQAPAAASIPGAIMQAQCFSRPRELLAARLSVRLPPRGALQREAPAQSSRRVLKMEGAFVLCVWHAHLDDLEVPLFAMVVSPDDWIEPS